MSDSPGGSPADRSPAPGRGEPRPGKARSAYAAVCLLLLAGLAFGVGLERFRERLIAQEIDEGLASLDLLRARMIDHRQAHGTFASVGPARSPCEVEEGSRTFGDFLLRCARPPEAGRYTLLAEGRHRMAGFVFSLDQDGRQSTVSAPQGWPVCPQQWATRRDTPC